MRNAGLILLFAVGACGPTAGPVVHRPVPPPPPPPAYQVATGDYITQVAADATHVYWSDGGIKRHAHGPDGETERLFASDSNVSNLGVGTDDVFFIDDGYILRALPKTGGAPSELTTFNDTVWGMVADGNGVWVGVGNHLERWSREPTQKIIELPGYGTYLAIADHVAYVTSYDGGTLDRVDLKTRKVTQLSDAWFIGQASGLAVSGKSVLLTYAEGVIAIPIDGGAEQITFATPVSALTADRDGYVVLESTALIDHHHGQAPRVIATSDVKVSLGGSMSLALGGGYAYHVDYDNTKGGTVLRGSPRASGATMLRLPLGTTVTDLAADGDHVIAAIEDQAGDHVARVGTRHTKVGADAPAYIEQLVAGGGEVAFSSAGALYTIEKGSEMPTGHQGDNIGVPLVIHKGLVYWASYMEIYAMKVTSDDAEPIRVADASSIPDIASDLQMSAIEFAADHLYFTLPWAGLQGLARVDEHHHTEMVWTYSQYTADAGSLLPDFTIIDETAYLHDANHVYAVPLDGSSARTLVSSDDTEIGWIDDAGPHLVADVRGPDGDQLVEIDRSTGKMRVLWRSYLDGGTPPYWDVGTGAIYIYSPELQSILAIPV